MGLNPTAAGRGRARPTADARRSGYLPTGDDDDDDDDDDAVAVATAAMRARIFINSYARVIARG